MCGIFGYVSDRLDSISPGFLESCRDALRHRGPDAAASFRDRDVYLGFRRLAILDLTPEGDQPMTSEDGRYTIVFNGEVYNFVELRKELEAAGETFRGHSDTEVLLRLYSRCGVRCFDRINGMYAFALYDHVERTLTLVRDRLGVKPLFLWQAADTFAFASEIRALRRLPGFPSELDIEALGLYFRLGAVPEWTSVYPGVTKLPPGSWTRYDTESKTLETSRTYWDLPPVREESGKNENQWVDEIEALLWDATRIRLHADVPLGLFLSGGIDSGLVAAAARQSGRLTSVTIGFPDAEEDETDLALTTAQHLGLHFVTRNVDLAEGAETLPRIMAYFDEPFSDTSALPTALVCAEARRELTVALSGDGGDEVFGGYENHVRAWRWRHIDHLPSRWLRTSSFLLASLSMRDSRPKRFFRRLGQPVGRFGLGGKLYPFQDWLAGCLKPEFCLSPSRIVRLYDEHLPKWAGASSIDMAQRTDLRNYMLEQILIKVDRMSMMHSLEVRSPFLDYRVVELGLSIPSSLRTKGGCNKYLLRRLAMRHLPERVCRAPKRGFGIPIRTWLMDKPTDYVFPATDDTPRRPNPFVKGGAERLWRLCKKNRALTNTFVMLSSYLWWCQYLDMV